jgi:membrane fusion protein, heavy metal efflux system
MKWLFFAAVVMLAGCTQAPKPVEASAPPKEETPTLSLSEGAKKNVALQTATATYTSEPSLLEAPGQLTWNEDRTWSMGIVATGKVMFVYAKVGDMVKKDQILARTHTHDIHDTQAMLRIAYADKKKAETDLEQAKRNRDRMKRLYEVKAAPLMQVEQSEVDVKNAEQNVKKAQAGIDREVQHLTEVLEISADLESLEKEGEPGHNHKHDEEEELVPVRATQAGVVVERKISVGSVATQGQDAYVVSDPSSLWLIASFPEVALPQLKVGAQVEVEVRAYPGRVFLGRIARLGETMDAQTRTLKVRVEMASQGVLRPEMYATIRLRGSGQRLLSIPEAALHEVDGKQTVFVRDAKGGFQPRAVEASLLNGRALLLSGLKEGEVVATEGSYYLKGQLQAESAK